MLIRIPAGTKKGDRRSRLKDVGFDLFDSETKSKVGIKTLREMFDVKDQAIKLFGKTIPLPENQSPVDSVDKSCQDGQIQREYDDMDACTETKKSEADDVPKEDLCNADKSSALNNVKEDTCQIPTPKENKATIDPDLKEEQVETDMSDQEKVLKKPDKILPCPRCNSMDTKFCYYNNYNVNQPRHFCKNCQRYWTAGGTMRNVPVGAGRRKNKHTASQYRHIVMSSEGMPTTRADIPDMANRQVVLCEGLSVPPSRPINGHRTILKFGPDVPLCESMVTVLSLGDQKSKVEMSGVVCGENGEELSSCGSSGTTSTCRENECPENVARMEQGCMPCYGNELNPPPLHCYPVPPLVYLDWNNVSAMAVGQGSSELVPGPYNGNPKPVQLGSMSMVPNIPFPFVPASYWGCMPSWAASAWNVPQIGSCGNISPSSSTSNGSPTLGKHSRDAKAHGEEKLEKSFWVPKTLRIDNPDEAAKSSIWDTLGIKPEQNEPITEGGIFKAFQPKAEGNCHASDTTQVLQANPAALSRSQTFQEAT